MTIRVRLADDQSMPREGLAALLEVQERTSVVARDERLVIVPTGVANDRKPVIGANRRSTAP